MTSRSGHHVANVRFTDTNEASAHVRSNGLAVMADGTAGTVIYDDIVVRTESGWRISRRKVIARREV